MNGFKKYRFTSFVVGVFVSSAANAFSLVDYLDAITQDTFQVWQYQTREQAQRLALIVGEEYLMPKISTSGNWQESVLHQQGATRSDSWKVGTALEWTAPVGTQVALNLDRVQQASLGNPTLVTEQYNNQFTVAISQPLLKHNTPSYQRLTLLNAQLQWDSYLNEGRQLQLEVLRQGTSNFLEFQRQHQRWIIYQALEESTRNSLNISRTLYRVGKLTEYDVLQAEAALEQRVQDVASAAIERELAAVEAMSELKIGGGQTLTPLSTFDYLIERLLPDTDRVEADLATHPEQQSADYRYQLASYAYVAQQDTHKPELDLFLQHQKNHFSISENNETNTYGVRFSYTFTNNATLQNQASLLADVEVADLERARTRQSLTVQYQAQNQRITSLIRQMDIMAKLITLADEGLQRQERRYQLGKASFYSLEEYRKTLLDKQLERLESQYQLVSSLLSLGYLQQLDIRTLL